MEFGEVVRRLRKERRWTQQELGARAGFPPGTISHIENGRNNNPTQETLTKLARALDVPVSELAGTEPDILDGPAPVANWRAWGVNEDQIRRYSHLWPALSRADRGWLQGQLQIFADAEAKIRRLEAQAHPQAGRTPKVETDPPVTDEEPDPVAQYMSA